MNKVYCPWCVSEMRLHYESYVRDDGGLYYYVCTNEKCFSHSPINEEKELAYAAALRRPLQKPLTLEEACGSEEPCVYLEEKDGGIFAAWVKAYEKTMLYLYSKREDVCAISTFAKHELFEKQKYNKTWRCWATKPTDEERKAAKWGEL